MKAIAVIDSNNLSLSIYDIPEHYDSERIEFFLENKGHKMSECNWAEFDGEINDYRND